MRPRSNRGGLPKPDSLGRWRPEVGCDHEGNRIRFQVGNKRDTTEADALKRLNAIRDLYDRQCAELRLSFWAGWVRGWALKLAQGVPVVVEASPSAASNSGQAAEELHLIRRLQSWGMPIIITDELPAIGHAHLRIQIAADVQRAVAAALAETKRRGGPDLIDETPRQTALPDDPTTAPRGTLY